MSAPLRDRIGPYAVLGLLGVGGMGQVYRARDSRLNRDVAIKVLPEAFASDSDRLERFSREAQILASLSHPNIASIFGLEETGGAAALVMELVEGQTLAERVASGPIPLDECLHIAQQITLALEAAHDKGIVHRDLKPANIKLTDRDQVKVLDFGLAKNARPTSATARNRTDSATLTLEHTQAGQIMGTAAYMSPEQARGKIVDKRSDIWAFGVVFYEMLTGKQLFAGETVSDTLANVLHAPLELQHLPQGVPARVRRVLERCLRRDPSQRLHDIADARIDLEPGDEATAEPVRVKRSASWVPWAAAVVLGAGLVGVVLRPSQKPAPQMVTRWGWPDSDRHIYLNLSRDGSRVAYTIGGGVETQIGVRMLDQLEGKAIAGTEGGAYPVFSPDGAWLLYITVDRKIKKVPVTGGSSVTLGTAPRIYRGAAWGDDNTILYSDGRSLFRLPVSGGSSEQVTTPDEKNGDIAHTEPQILEGTQQAIFSILDKDGLQHKVGLLDLQNKSYRAIARGGEGSRYVPSGHLVYFRRGTLFAIPFDLRRKQVTGDEVPVVDGIAVRQATGTSDYTFADSGLLVYASVPERTGSSFSFIDTQGGEKPIAGSINNWGQGKVSPDATRVAGSITQANDERDIWLLDTNRGTTTRLTTDGTANSPAWSADGKKILYGSAKGGKFAVYSVPADASGRPELMLESTSQVRPTSATPDGRVVIFDQRVNDSWRIMQGAAGSQPTALHEVQSLLEFGGQVSPDGKWLAYVSSEPGAENVYVEPFPGPGAKVRISPDGGTLPRWAPDGRRLYYWQGSGPSSALARLMSVEVRPGPTLAIGTARKVLEHPSGTIWGIAPDEKRFVIEALPDKVSSLRGRVVAVSNWFDELRHKAPIKQ